MYHYHLGSGEFLAAFKEPVEIKGIYAHYKACVLVLGNFCLYEEVSAVNKVEAESLAAVLVGIM